ncbi:hypothetical protein I79_024007 [Cricetulus griseus]|uniref:Disks large homolog 5 N-terminal domain-containing protein n=1 Tax=Cricetulus griseus TaxID=10029 RepID=G3IJH2_CRIGR|nr:hypothetical protein I79_024007 [Cricetulus griseus]
MKQKELVTQQRDLAVKLQHHFSESQMRFEHLQHELEQTTDQEESLLKKELLQQEHCVPGKFEHLQHELEQTTAQEESLLQTELLQQEHCVPGKLKSELEILKMERQKEMSDMKKFPKEISEALSKCKVLTEKTNSYRFEHLQHELEQTTDQEESLLQTE